MGETDRSPQILSINSATLRRKAVPLTPRWRCSSFSRRPRYSAPLVRFQCSAIGHPTMRTSSGRSSMRRVRILSRSRVVAPRPPRNVTPYANTHGFRPGRPSAAYELSGRTIWVSFLRANSISRYPYPVEPKCQCRRWRGRCADGPGNTAHRVRQGDGVLRPYPLERAGPQSRKPAMWLLNQSLARGSGGSVPGRAQESL